jgi:exopolysaccharide biosynthesis polyprenyl glycosylphosphotransferase
VRIPPTPGLPAIPARQGRVDYSFWPGLVLASDAAIIAACFVGCYLARFEWGLLPPAAPAPAFGPYLHASVLVAFVWTACLAWVGLYEPRREPSRFDDLVLLATGLALGAAGTLALSFFYRSFSYSRLVAAYALVAAFVALTAWHLGLRALQARRLAQGLGARRTLILGQNELGEAIAARLRGRPRLGQQVVGVVPATDDAWVQAVDASGADTVLIAWPEAPGGAIAALVRRIGALAPDVEIQIAPDLAGLGPARVEARPLDGIPLLAVRPVALRRRRNRALKRALDVGLGGLGLLALAPLLGAIALAVRADSPGPALYAQARLGRDGRVFTIYKFRTMPIDAEPDGPVWAKAGDNRATALGSLLRRYSLDELPQLWNVLIGDMSLVGPRPERPHFVDQFRETVPQYMDRHLARCGLTGWAQVNGLRGDVSIEERTRHDLWYVENWSLLLDLRILLDTAGEIVRRPAY